MPGLPCGKGCTIDREGDIWYKFVAKPKTIVKYEECEDGSLIKVATYKREF